MKEFFQISAKALCAILSAELQDLGAFEKAIREALERANSEEELKSIKEKACIKDSLGTYEVTKGGKPRLL